MQDVTIILGMGVMSASLIEDVTAYYHIGLAESARVNPLSKLGFATNVPSQGSTIYCALYHGHGHYS